MLKKSTQTIFIALGTSAALMAFTFYQSRGAFIPVSDVTLYVAAAIICLSPVVYARRRCKTRRNTTSNAG